MEKKERKKERRKKNKPVPLQRLKAAHALRSDQKETCGMKDDPCFGEVPNNGLQLDTRN